MYKLHITYILCTYAYVLSKAHTKAHIIQKQGPVHKLIPTYRVRRIVSQFHQSERQNENDVEKVFTHEI